MPGLDVEDSRSCFNACLLPHGECFTRGSDHNPGSPCSARLFSGRTAFDGDSLCPLAGHSIAAELDVIDSP